MSCCHGPFFDWYVGRFVLWHSQNVPKGEAPVDVFLDNVEQNKMHIWLSAWGSIDWFFAWAPVLSLLVQKGCQSWVCRFQQGQHLSPRVSLLLTMACGSDQSADDNAICSYSCWVLSVFEKKIHYLSFMCNWYHWKKQAIVAKTTRIIYCFCAIDRN